MYDDIQRLIDRVVVQNSPLELTVRLYEKKESHAPLGMDVAALEPLLFAGGVAEFMYSYASYLAEDRRPIPYSRAVFANFERQFRERIGGAEQSWIDLYENKMESCYEVFKAQLLHIDGGYWAVASGDILRLELVEVWKENPSVRKIIVTGVTAAVMLLAGTFGGIHIAKEYHADACRQEWRAYGNQQAEMLRQVGRFQGKFPEQSYSKLQDAVNGQIAACGSPLANIGVRLDPKGSVGFEMWSPEK